MIPIKYFVSILLLIVLITSMIYCSKEESKPNNKNFTPAPAPSLTYAEQTITFSSITGVTKTLAVAKILAGVRGSKEGYTIKSITLVSSNTTASAKVSGTQLTFTKIGNIVFNLVLKHASKEDATIKNCKIIISKNAAATLTFNRVSKAFVSGGSFTTSEILAGVTGTKSGYTLKEIKALAPSGVASVTGTKPNLSLRMTKIGSFTATIVLEHSTKGDVTITAAEFKISSSPGERLTFGKLTKVYSSGGRFTTAEILGRVGGTKAGYTLREMRSLNPTGVASVTGTKPNLSLSHAKAGNFTATLVLEHATKGDSTIDNASFEITKASAPILTWTKQSKPYGLGGEISNAELLAGLTGSSAAKTGYTIKSVTISSANGTDARVSGSGTAAKIVGYTQAGTLTLTLVFQHPAKMDVTLTGKKFEITKASAPILTWTKQSKPYGLGGEISNAELLAGLNGTSAAKTGYTIKSVIISSANGTGARVSGRGTSAKIVGYTQAGILTLTLVFQHPAKMDVTLTGKKFEITKASASGLTWTKQSKPYGSGGEISNAELLAGLTGSSAAKTGYTIKSVTISSANGTSARVSGTGTSAKIVGYTQAGTLTLTLVFQHPAKADVTLRDKVFEITKASASGLTWTKQSKPYVSGGEISNAELLAGLTGSSAAKTGYTIKSVTISSANGTDARVSGSGTAAKIVGYTQAGTLTLTLVFQHPAKMDVTLTGKKFEITKASASGLTWTKQSKPYGSGGEISNGELLAGLTGSSAAKTGYTIKSVTISSANGTGARISGTGTSAKIVGYTKAGTLTLTLVFEHSAKVDVTLTGKEFEIRKAGAESLTWRKQTKVYSSGEITHAQLLAGVQGSKTGYTIKTVNITNHGGMTSARVVGSGRAAKITSYNKVGTFTLTLVLQHNTKEDVTLRNAAFEITKANAESLTWTKQTKHFNSGGEITNADLLVGVTGSGKNGYTIKTVTITNKNGTGARVAGSGRAAKITSYNKVGTLTLTLVLEHDAKKDVTLTGAKFEIYKIFDITSSGVVTLKSSVDRNSLTVVIIPNTIDGTTVTSIGNSTFKFCNFLISITMGNSVTSIGSQAFYSCRSLTSITMGNSVTSIGEEAFYSCRSLTSITIPNIVTIGAAVFSDCTSLTNITIPSIVTIGVAVFSGCTSLTNITMGNSLTSIGIMAFNNCRSLTSITMGNSVTSIGKWIFKNCSSLTTIKLPNSITTIGDEPFTGCSSLTTIHVPTAKVTIWEDNLQKGNSASVVGY